MEDKGATNPYLEVLLYRGRIQLATHDAIYSDGLDYAPAIIAVKQLRHRLPAVRSALVLGVGMGSIVQVMGKAGCTPTYTLVELDSVVLKLAMELLGKESSTVLDPICADAEQFMAANKQQYGFIFIDIFNSREVPDFVTTLSFLQQCRQALLPGGVLALNYIVGSDARWQVATQVFDSVFPGYRIISSDVNRVFVAEV